MSDSSSRTGAELLVAALCQRDVELIFGFPGDTSIALYEALRHTSSRLRHVLARDERHAGFMADAYSRTTGRIGVCESSSGAGAVYLASGLGEARAASIPLLAITTDNSTRSAGTSPISEVDQEALFAACTKWLRTVRAAGDLPGLVDEAFRVAVSGRPGPVALIIPEDVLEQVVRTTDAEARLTSTAPNRPVAPADAMAAAVSALADADRPCIVAGGGVHLSRAWPDLRALAEHAAVPVATTIHGKGAIDERHPLALGVVGGNGARDYANAWVASSDCVMFVGTRANATDTLGFSQPPRDGTVTTIHVEQDAERAGRNYPGSVALVGDAATVLRRMRVPLPQASAELSRSRRTELDEARSDWAGGPAHSAAAMDVGVLHPRDVVQTLGLVFGADTWVTADAGTPTPYLACFWEAPGDGWRVVIPRGHGPMGYAIPASVAIALGHPGDRVLCMTTENSLAMAVAEWETARRLNLPITFVVLDNTSLCWIKMIQHLYGEAQYFGVDPGPIDPVLLARGMGLGAVRAFDIDELRDLAQQSASAAGPTVIHVRVPEHMDLAPPVATWEAALSGQHSERPIH